MACPLTTGIFLCIVAEAAEERRREGAMRITPHGRVIDNNGGLRERFPGGVQAHARYLRAEGHTIAPARGRQPPRVKAIEESLIDTEWM